MTGDEEARDERLMTLFEIASSLPPGERERWLHEACADDPELAADVLEQIHWEGRMGSFLVEPLVPRLPADPVLEPGDLLDGRVRIVRRIAAGGMATVYEAADDKLGRIAVKVPNQAYRSLLIREARHALQVTHPNICRVHGIHSARVRNVEFEYLTMEYLEGETLQARLLREGPLPAHLIDSLTTQLCAALEESHRWSIVHGDLKGNNVMLAADASGNLRAVVTDFGLARKNEGASPLAAASLRGAPDFIAPELWRGARPSPASDLYALGVMLYEAATGQRPSRGQEIRSPRSLRPELRENWSRTIVQCLKADPAERPSSAAEVAEKARDRHFPRAGVLGIVLFLILLAVFAYREHSRPQPIRLAVMPPETDDAARTWAPGAARHAMLQLGGMTAEQGSLVVIPWAEDSPLDRGARLLNAGATHVLRTRVSSDGGRLNVSGGIYDVARGRELKSFAGTYQTASLDQVPKLLLAAVAGALQLRAVAGTAGLTATAWRDYASGNGLLLQPKPDYAAAVAAFDRAARSDPSSALPQAAKAEAYVAWFLRSQETAHLKAAGQALAEAERRAPDELAVHLVAGAYDTAGGLYERAVARYLRALELAPGNVDAMRRLARAYAALDMPDTALNTWKQALAVLPQDYNTYLDLGQFYYRRADYPNAASNWQQAVRLAPDHPRAHHNLGAAWNDMARYADAEREFSEALRLQPHSDTLIGLGSVMSYQGRHAESVMYYERARAAGPVGYILLSNLADGYRRTGRAADAARTYAEALDAADARLQEHPRDAYVRAFVGYACARLGDKVRAGREIEQALRLSPDDTKVRRRVALAKAALGEVDRAVDLIEEQPLLKPEIFRHPDVAEFRGRLR